MIVRSVRQPPAAVWADAPVILALDRQIAKPTDYRAKRGRDVLLWRMSCLLSIWRA
jgi:hypothetical protein